MRKSHKLIWEKYFIEAWGLGVFMISACSVTLLLEHPQSVLHSAIPSAFIRRFVMGLCMGITAWKILDSKWGKKSGAHINPAVTLTMYRLGKINGKDTLAYIIFQFAGGTAGVLVVALLTGNLIQEEHVMYAVTVPGKEGILAAMAGEIIIAFCMMSMVMITMHNQKWTTHTSRLAGLLVMGNVIFESPYSGFGMNPARTFASALPSGVWTSYWMYALVPVVTMMVTAEIFSQYFKYAIKLRALNRVKHL